MKYLIQFGIIITISFIGEMLHDFLPLPVPASIYGIILLFALLHYKILHVAQIRETSMLLISLMAFLFLPTTVGLLGAWDYMKPMILSYILINILTLIIGIGGAGLFTQWILTRKKEVRHD